jgi:hypothetical protein
LKTRALSDTYGNLIQITPAGALVGRALWQLLALLYGPAARLPIELQQCGDLFASVIDLAKLGKRVDEVKAIGVPDLFTS